MSRDNKVLFITKYYYPHLGGVEKHVAKVSETLRKEKFAQITILTEQYDKALSPHDKHNNCTIVRITYPHIKLLGIIGIWLEMVKQIRLFYASDVVHVHDVFIWIIPIRFILFWKKFYITYHGWEGIYPIPVKSLLQKKLAYYLTNGNICIGRYLEQLYGIKSTFTSYGSTSLNSRKIRLNKLPDIVYIGRLENDTGIPLLLESLKKTKQRIVFYGDGYLRNDCEKVGVVKGFVKDIKKALENTNICFASGYLTVLDSLASTKITAVISDSYVREMAFRNTEFSPWISILTTKEEVINFLSSYPKIKDTYIEKTKAGHQWAIKQTWNSMTQLYLHLWNS